MQSLPRELLNLYTMTPGVRSSSLNRIHLHPGRQLESGPIPEDENGLDHGLLIVVEQEVYATIVRVDRPASRFFVSLHCATRATPDEGVRGYTINRLTARRQLCR